MEQYLKTRAAVKGGGQEAIFLDKCFSESFSWNKCDISVDTPIYSLGEADFDGDNESISSVVVFTSCLARESAYTIRRLLTKTKCAHCTIYTSVSPEAATGIIYSISRKKQSGHQDNDMDYAALKDLLGLPNIVIAYFPLHTVHILAPEVTSVPLGVLSAQSSQNAQPVSLSGLRTVAAAENAPDSREYRSVSDINASDLSGSVKHNLKSLAHDLAGSLVFDYGLDVSTSVHALGKTSSILGHNILPILERLAELRVNQSTSMNMSDGLQLHAALHPSSSMEAPLQHAALILLDRTEDLATPISAGTAASSQLTAPLAHRIVNTLNYCQYLHATSECTSFEENKQELGTQIDVTLKAPLLEETSFNDAADLLGISLPLSGAVDTNDLLSTASASWNKPLSALSNLPLQLNPSLQYSVSSASTGESKLLQNIMAGTEELGKVTLCAEIRDHIVAENGQLPPNKKRGLGAEVLAFTQALISAPGAAPTSKSHAECTTPEETALAQYRGDITPAGLGYNYAVSMRSQPLLCLGLAVIESMQRSSGKQFQPLCDWQCAYDTRTAREAEVDQMARKFDDFDICIAHVMSYFLPGKAAGDAGSVSTEGHVLKSKASTSKLTAGGDKEAPPTAGPVDVVHILIQTIRLMSLFRQRVEGGSSNLGALEECICDFVMRSSCVAELEYLCGLRFLSTATVEEVLQHRLVSSELDTILARQVEGAHSQEDIILLEVQAVAKELSLKQLKSSIRDQIHRTFQALVELQTHYAVQKQALFAKPTSSTGALHSTLDLLATPGKAADTNQSLGLVGRIAQGYLTHSAEQQRSQHLFANSHSGTTQGGEGDSARVLNELFEFVESPLEKMKRAGLGLLSKGLGSLFGSQVASAVSTPHPSEQPVLVIFVLGGISYKEVGQVQQLLSAQNVKGNARIILLSTRMLNAENVLHSFCL